MPPESSVEACDFTGAGTAGFSSTPVRKDELRAAMTIAPVSAVPTEMPRLVTVFCRPPTSPLCSSGTEETVTLPSCEASAPIPRPARSSGTVTISAPAPASRAPTRTTSPANIPRKPRRTTWRGETSGKAFGIPAAARIRAKESGSRRTPVSIAESPSAIERKSGIAKNMPPWRKYWKKNEVRPARRTEIRRIAGFDERLAPACSTRRSSQARKSAEHRGAAEQHPDHRREPDPFRRVGLGLDDTPGAGAQDAEHDQPQAGGGERGADQVQPHLPLRLAGGDAAGERRGSRARSGPRRRRRSARRGRW